MSPLRDAEKQAVADAKEQRATKRVIRTAERAQQAEEKDYTTSLLTVADVALCLEVSAATVRNLIKKKELAVAQTREFYKWGKSLAATLHDPDVVLALMHKRRPDLASKIVATGRPLTPPRPPPVPTHAQMVVWWDALTALLPGSRSDHHSALTVSWTASVLQRSAVALVVALPKPIIGSLLAGGLDEAESQARLRQQLDDLQKTWVSDFEQDVQQRIHTWDAVFQVKLTDKLVGRLNQEVRLETLMDANAYTPHPWRHLINDTIRQFLENDPTCVAHLWEKSGMPHVLDWFPVARANKRRWTVWLGPTNSGKTHAAMELLKAASSGIYLAPLRLMALEAFDRLAADGVACSLITGEERRDPENGDATHVSATIEAGLSDQRWAVAVIDEAQMLNDRERGWAWTQALVGVAADHLCVCAAPEAEGALRALAARLGETIEVHHLERMTPLHVLDVPVPLKLVEPGDAVVGFSRQQVLGYRAWLRDHGHSVACLYGDLGPEVRQREAERFRTGEAQVLVATDAIGMGLNLPLKRVLFAAVDKYDGVSQRPLLAREWKQIGGRAGRRGFHEVGYVGVLQGLPTTGLAKGMDTSLEAVSEALPLRPTREIALRVAEQFGFTRITDVLETMARWASTQNEWNHESLRTLAVDPWTVAVSKLAISVNQQFNYLGCPVRRNNQETVKDWAWRHSQGDQIGMPKGIADKVAGSPDELAVLEARGHLLSAYRWLARHFPEAYPDYVMASKSHAGIQDVIARTLAKQALRRLCNTCGKTLKVEHPFPECQPCYLERQERRGGRGYY